MSAKMSLAVIGSTLSFQVVADTGLPIYRVSIDELVTVPPFRSKKPTGLFAVASGTPGYTVTADIVNGFLELVVAPMPPASTTIAVNVQFLYGSE